MQFSGRNQQNLKMVVTDQSDIISQGEVESPLQSADQQQPKNHNAFPSLGHQSSIYSLTLDEFQHTLSDGGKNFGSMNMDELLDSIWTAEENQTHAHAQVTNSSIGIPTAATTGTATTNINAPFPQGEISTSTEKSIAKQPSLPRQGSLTLPAPLCRKTLEKVWSEMHKTQQQQHSSISNVQNTGSSQRQPTFGEMTLEDFLVKAGVVREQGHPPPPLPLPNQPYGLYQNNNNTAVGPSYMARPIMAIGGGGGGVSVLAYPAVPQSAVGDAAAGFVLGGKRSAGGYQPPAICYGGRIPNGGSGGGYGQVQGLGLGLGSGSPVSPVSSDGMGTNQGDSMNQYGLDMGGMRGGRKRIIDGSVEKVVERRQRRMIKNRESAARSRARKQAYTVELEAELNQLKEENAHLKQALAELERKIKQEYFEEAKMKAQTKAQKAKGRMKLMRWNMSCPY